MDVSFESAHFGGVVSVVVHFCVFSHIFRTQTFASSLRVSLVGDISAIFYS